VPFDRVVAAAIGEAYTPLHNNCSGKHAGMLAHAKHKGWPVEGYLEPSHPVQKACLTAVADAAGVRPDRIHIGVDGCGVPAYAMTLQAAARAFAWLASPDAAKSGMREPLTRIQGAMRAHPEIVAGTGRLDTKVAKATRGRVLVKAGAEAFYGAAVLDAKLGVAIKVDDGAWRAVGPIIGAVLDEFGELTEGEKEALKSEFHPTIKNHAGRTVGRMEPVVEF
jgi:L-asparaginase II